MGDQNQLLYMQYFGPKVADIVLEVGSKDYGSTVPFRKHVSHTRYVGLDMENGPGVDVVGDLTQNLCGLEPETFSLIICCSVLEHVRQPWVMAENMTTLLAPGGCIYISVPWVWRYHAYPDDYFRFSWRGIETIFPHLQWRHCHYSTNVPGEIFPAAPGIDDGMATYLKARKHLPYLAINMLGDKT